DVTGFAPHQLTRLGLSRSFQVTSVFPALTAEETLAVAAMAAHPRRTGIRRRPRWPGAVAERAEELLDPPGLTGMRHREAAVHGVALELADGEVAALLGRNGSGRSTTLKAIMGMVPRRAGRVCFAGTEIAGWAPYRVARAGIAYVPEDRRVFANLTVAENLALAAMRGRPGYWNPERIGEVFPILTERARQPARTLSGGQQQMLAIGRALAANPG